MMEMNRLENAFNECLRQLLTGSTMEQVLTPYADLAGELEPMLHVALAAHHYAKAIRVPEPAQSRSRQRFLATAAQANLAQQEQRARKQSGSGRRGFWNSLFALPAMARVVVILLLALVLGGTSSVVASAQALPGDALYPLKLATEQTRLLLTSGTAARLNLEQSFDQKRLEELNALLQRSRSEEIIFARASLEYIIGLIVVESAYYLAHLFPQFRFWKAAEINLCLCAKTSLSAVVCRTYAKAELTKDLGGIFSIFNKLLKPRVYGLPNAAFLQ